MCSETLFNKSKTFLLVLLLVVQGSAYAQRQEVQKYQRLLHAASDDQVRINLQNAIAYECRVFDADSALYYAGIAHAEAVTANYKYGEGMASLMQALAYNVKGSFRLSLDYSKRSLQVAEQLRHDSLRAACYLAMSLADNNLAAYDDAIEKGFTAIKLFERSGSPEGVIRTRLAMAQVYQVKGNIPEAEKILKQSVLDSLSDKKIKVNTMHTLANIYGMQEKYAEALELDRQALIICEQNGFDYLKSAIYDNMGNVFMYSGNEAKAKDYFHRCLMIDSSFGNKKQMSDTYLNLGFLATMNGKPQEAVANLRHALMYARESGYKLGAYNTMLALGKAFSAGGQKDSALRYVNAGYQLKDSVLNERSEARVQELEQLYDTEKKEQEIVKQKDRVTRQRYLLIALAALVALLSLLGISFYRKRQLQSKLNLQNEISRRQEMATKAVIEAEEKERQRIASDLHDGIGQMMSAAKMNLSVYEEELNFRNEKQRAGFENVIGLVDDSCREIRNVSHQMMPNALLKSGLPGALKEFINRVDTRVLDIQVHSEGMESRLPADKEIILYRVIQESVNNVLKHAEASRLDISIHREQESIDIIIEDNGKGFVVKDDKTEGLGLQNARTRIQYLKGSIDFSSEPGKGTLVAIHVPLNIAS